MLYPTMDITETQNNFVNNFIYKNKRERVFHELNSPKKRNAFLSKLNHNSLDLIDGVKLQQIPKNIGEIYTFIVNQIGVNDKSEVLILSNYEALDGKVKPFNDAFEDLKNYSGFASMFIFENGEKIYLQTEPELGASIKYIGII